MFKTSRDISKGRGGAELIDSVGCWEFCEYYFNGTPHQVKGWGTADELENVLDKILRSSEIVFSKLCRYASEYHSAVSIFFDVKYSSKHYWQLFAVFTLTYRTNGATMIVFSVCVCV